VFIQVLEQLPSTIEGIQWIATLHIDVTFVAAYIGRVMFTWRIRVTG